VTLPARAARLPGPPGLLPGRADAVVDLRTEQGAALVGGVWRYRDADLVAIDSPTVGPDLGPSGPPVRTWDIEPHAEAADHDDRDWEVLAAPDTEARRGRGRVCFAWYRITVTLPERVGDLPVAGSTVVFEVVVDDYAEVWVDGALPVALGQAGGQVVGGFNVANRVVVARDARPGQRIVLAVFAMNGPVSASPRNFLWLRSATLDLYTPRRARVAREVGRPEVVFAPGAVLEQVAADLNGTAGAVCSGDGALLVSSPGADAVLRWTPDGTIGVFRTKSGSAGLAFDPQGRLTICEPGRGRVVRVEPHGNVTVLAQGLDRPGHLAYDSHGALWVTDGRGLHRVDGGPEGAPVLRLEGARGVACDPGGDALYVADLATVLRVPLGAGAAATADGWWTHGKGAQVQGLAVAATGHVLACADDAVHVLTPQGTPAGRIDLPEPATGVAPDAGDAATVYITTTAGAYRLASAPRTPVDRSTAEQPARTT